MTPHKALTYIQVLICSAWWPRRDGRGRWFFPGPPGPAYTVALPPVNKHILNLR